MHIWPIIALSIALCLPSRAHAAPLDRIEHIIVISLENHSFDNLFGFFPGAEGIEKAGDAAIQADPDGEPYKTLPPVIDTRKNPAIIDSRFPIDLPNRPFPIDQYIPLSEETGDLVHSFKPQQEQINGGLMNKFVSAGNTGALPMGYYDGSKLGLWKYAQQYTLTDHFFHAAFGGSFLNHIWMVCACTPRYENAPEELVSHGSVTQDGYAVNTLFPQQGPYPPNVNKNKLLPPQAMLTIGDRLSEKDVSWAWYAGGWNDAVAGKASRLFQFHHQPFTYFSKYAEGSPARTEHLRDESDFLQHLKDGTLPAVAFYKPLGEFNLHPGYGDILSGDSHVTKILQAIEQSPIWENTVVIVTFDENGGYWDHVAPPVIDRWGPGMRVPTIIISPFAKKGFIDHTVYDTTSILKLIEMRFGLEPVGTRNSKVGDLTNTLDL